MKVEEELRLRVGLEETPEGDCATLVLGERIIYLGPLHEEIIGEVLAKALKPMFRRLCERARKA